MTTGMPLTMREGMKKPIIYLASPYWHESETVRLSRLYQTQQATANLLANGFIVYSPICHNAPLVKFIPEVLQHSHNFWMSVDLPILSKADSLWVLTLDGWQQSRGIAIEVEHANSLGIPVTYLPSGEELADPKDRGNLTRAESAAP